MTRRRATRRTYLQRTLGALTVGSLLAGCSANGSSDDGGDGDGSGNGGDDGPDFDGWFSNTSNFDGVVDETGASEVTVDVGAEGNTGNYAFGPAAVKVDAGTTVTWEWTGKGSMHNVVAQDGSFESKLTASKGHTFDRTFDEPGTYEYYCSPHEPMGMKGAVVVE